MTLEIIISILHSENSLHKNTSPAPGFDEEAELPTVSQRQAAPSQAWSLAFYVISVMTEHRNIPI